eukprot:TRINITY_DN10282_c0_g1_i1.p1 TRINITY_DN10282_c0_g1~~TRINITY_DN10282_c0_g1_i1.p1  ORF type:complete len:596 (-),score=171.02 TRINITY_DN10282_c0_g1_i1:150-1688(-)
MSDSVTKQVKREIEALSKIQHKNVISLKHVDWNATYEQTSGEKIDIILTVLELASGGELFEFLSATGAFEETLARTYFKQLVSGLEYMQSKKIAHRDLKPDNLLFDENFVLKIADFGFAAAFKENDTNMLMTTECGTPGYMAPEIFSSKGYNPMISDIWSCGVILFIMLAGFPPFQKPVMSDWWFNKLANNKHSLFWQAHSRNAFFSNDAMDFINKVLCVDPSKRMNFETMKKHPWFTGTTLTDTQLVSELTRRKSTIDEDKRQASEVKQRQVLAEHAATSRKSQSNEFDPSSVRAVSTAAIPDLPPSFTLFNKRPLILATPTFDSLKTLSFTSTSSTTDSKTKSTASSSFKLTPYNEQTSLPCYSKFESDYQPQKLWSAIRGALQALDCKYAKQKKSTGYIKLQLSTGCGDVTFVVKMYQHPSDQKKLIVTCRRRTGDTCAFRDLYFHLREQLGEVIAKSNEKETKKSASSVSSFSSSSSSSNSFSSSSSSSSSTTTSITSSSKADEDIPM